MLSRRELWMSVLLPAALLTVVFVGPVFVAWHVDVDKREASLRREIAQNFAEKWGRCDLAANWDKTVPCLAR